MGGATPLKPLTPGTQCDVFEYSRGTRGVWNLFEPPYEPAVDRWSACARQRAPLLLSLGRAPSDGASELIAAVDRLSGRHEVFECESSALAAGTGPDEACSLIARGQLDDWRCTDALASLGRGRLLHHDTRTGEYVVLELVPPPPDTADAFEGLNATEAAEAEAEAVAEAEATAAAQAAAAGGAALRARQPGAAWRAVTWGKSSALVGTTVLQLHDSVVITVAELVPGAAEPPAYAMWLYDRAAAGGCCPAEDASVVELLAHSHRRLVCAPSDDADPEAPPTYTTADAGVYRTAAAAAAPRPSPRTATLPRRGRGGGGGGGARGGVGLCGSGQPGGGARAGAPPRARELAPFGADRLLAFDGGAGFAATDAEHVRVWTLQRGVAPEAWVASTARSRCRARRRPSPSGGRCSGRGRRGRRRATRRRAPRAATPGCGWCTERGTCIQGDAAAPCASDECAAALYAAQSCTASGIACGMLTSCADCAVVDGCGWCGADGQCVADYDDGRASHCKGPEREYVNDVGKCDAGLNDQRRGVRRLFRRG